MVCFGELLSRVQPTLFYQSGVFAKLPGQAQSVLGPFQGYFQGGCTDGLGNEVGGLELESLNRQVHISVGGDDNHLFIGFQCLDLLEHRNSIHTWHAKIGKGNVRPLVSKDL